MSVLISGAGIAGPTLAYWLSVHGLQPTLIERAPQLVQAVTQSIFGVSVTILQDKWGFFRTSNAMDMPFRNCEL